MIIQNITKQLTYSDTFTTGMRAVAPKIGFKPFIGGVTEQDILNTCHTMHMQQFRPVITYIGTAVLDIADTLTEKNAILSIMHALFSENISATFLLQPTQLGLLFNAEACYEIIAELASAAELYDHTITLQTAHYENVQTAMSIAEQLHERYPAVTTVVQAHLYRAQDDINALRNVPVMLTKRYVNESAAVAFQESMDIDLSMIELIEQRLRSGAHTIIATHDENIIAFTKQFAKTHGIAPGQFAFQLQSGQNDALAQQLVSEGYNVHMHFPCGAHWFTYFTTHLIGRPQNIKYVAQNVTTNKSVITIAAIGSVLLLSRLLKKR